MRRVHQFTYRVKTVSLQGFHHFYNAFILVNHVLTPLSQCCWQLVLQLFEIIS